MPQPNGSHLNGVDQNCRRCHTQPPVLIVRTEPLCKPCFAKYVNTKVVKRMESFRVRHSEPGQEKTLLLALSLGISSLTLLHVLSSHLETQRERTERTGFRLLVLHLDCSVVEGGFGEEGRRVMEGVRERWAQHEYEVAKMSDIFDHEKLSDLLPPPIGTNGNTEPSNYTNDEKLLHILASLPSPTSRADMAEILKRKLILHTARQHSCSAILCGSSTTRLAERTLSETAKGRGASLPWQVSDGESANGAPMRYPMRDLLRKELIAHAKFIEPPLDELVVQEVTKPPVSTKNMTIDELVKQYFESVEVEYPSIVANVVRTTGKLVAPPVEAGGTMCQLCDATLLDGDDGDGLICYGCARTMNGAAR